MKYFVKKIILINSLTIDNMFSKTTLNCLHVILLLSGIASTMQIKQTTLLSAPLTNFLIHEDKLYIGGANKIYVLDKDLNQLQTANTCISGVDECSENINKILLVHRTELFHILVSCGTGNSGVCEARNISHLESVLWSSSSDPAYDNYLTVSTNKNRPAVGLITAKGEFIIALTFGDGIFFSGDGKVGWTYKYAISGRELDLFKPVSRNYNEKILKLKTVTVPVHGYLIYYKVCFQHNGMTYFATNQGSEVGSFNFVSKLVRICQNDTAFQSYTDIVINCNRHNTTYNLIQDAIIVDSKHYSGKVFIGVFTRGRNPEQPYGDSVICVTELRKINEALIKAQMDYTYACNGSGPERSRYLPAYKKSGICVRSKDFVHFDPICKTTKTYSNVIGQNPINIQANIYTPNATGHITTLASANYDNKSVIIFGTSTGIIIQTVLLQRFSFVENFKVTVDPGNTIKKIYAIGEDIVYAMSNKRVFKYSTTNCSEFQSCADMVKKKHPLCGWCVFRGRATRRSECSEEPGHWISSFGKCLTISVKPSTIPLSTASTSSNISIIIETQDIPEQNIAFEYQCRFSNKYKVIAAQLSDTTYFCLFPIVSEPGDVKIDLLVSTQEGMEITLSSAFILIYECRRYKRCIECINSTRDLCQWCGQDANCQQINTECPGPISEVDRCPQLLNNKGIYIPMGVGKLVSLKIVNPVNFTEVIYKCILSPSESTITAMLDGNIVSCPLQVMDNGLYKKRNYRVGIAYGPGKDRLAEIDDIFANSVTVYRCRGMATDCSHCQALNKSRYNCYWGDANECVHSGVSPVSHCPSPNITEVIPKDGSIYGGTQVTIYGRELGSDLSHINIIKMANVPCDLKTDVPVITDPDYGTFVPSRLFCETRPVPMATKGPVSLILQEAFLKTNIEFSYKRPSISGIYPNFGPKAGGTSVTVYGKHLGIGNRRKALSLGKHQCEETRDVEVTAELSDAEDSEFECVIKCRTNCNSNVRELLFLMDGKRVDTDKKLWFSFVDNPVVEPVSPLKAFARGGTLLTVKGEYLNHSHSSSIILRYKEENAVAKCEIVSAKKAVCAAPNAPSGLKEQLESQLSSARKEGQRCDMSINVSVELHFDGVIHNVTTSYYNDPVIDILPAERNVLTLDSSEPWIFISGECFVTVSRDFDIDIKVGDKPCIIINMTQTSIMCFPPVNKPRGIPWNQHLNISVSLGNIHVTVGYLRYINDENESGTMFIVYVSVAAFFIGILISGAIFICRRFRNMKNRVAYLEVKKGGGMRQRHRQNIRSNWTAYKESGVYDEIKEEDVLENPVDTNGENLDDINDGYLVPYPYTYANQNDLLDDFSKSYRKMDAKEDIDTEAVNTESYIHPIYDMSEIRHVEPHRDFKMTAGESETAEVLMNTKKGDYAVSYSCNKEDTEIGDSRETLESIKADTYIVPYACSPLDEEENADTSNSLKTSDVSEKTRSTSPSLDSNYIHPVAELTGVCKVND